MILHAGDRIVRGACPHDCPDTCAFIYDVKNGKLVDVTGDPDHPMTRGGLCVKLNGFAEHHYNPERLLYTMRSTGSKGSGRVRADFLGRRARRNQAPLDRHHRDLRLASDHAARLSRASGHA